MTATSLLPELGPHLGRLCALAAPTGAWVALDDIRLDLATGVLELASAARAFGEDRAAVVGAMRRHEWLAQWDRALGSTVDRTVQAIDDAFVSAAAQSRMPSRRVVALKVTPDEQAAITARLGAGAAPFVAALDRMDEFSAPAARAGTDSEAAFQAWWDSVVEVARRLEAAWDSMERAALAEEPRWRREIEETRAWRRPSWPLWLLSALVLALATSLGLVLGGYMPVPSWLRPLAEFWWAKVPGL